MPNKPTVSVITLHYLTRVEQLNRALDSLNSIGEQADEIILVDNGSHPACYEMLKDMTIDFPKLKIHRIEKNVGYVRGLNTGINRAQGTHCVFVANDVVLQEGDLADLATDGICFPEIYEKGKVVVPYWNGNIFGFPNDPYYKHDTRFYMFYSDTDLWWRAQEDGVPIRYNPNVKVDHVQGTTLNKEPGRAALYEADHKEFIKKWSFDPDQRVYDLLNEPST